MIDLALSLVVTLAAAIAPPRSEDQSPGARSIGEPASDPHPIDALVIDADVPDLVVLEAAVRLRIGATPVTRSDRARPPRAGELFAYLEILPGEGDRTTLRLTLGDARAWVRAIDAPQADRTREIATTLGNLMAGIEHDAIAPDLRDVPLPTPLQPAPEPAPRPIVPTTTPPSPGTWGIGIDGGVVFETGSPPPQGFGSGGFAVRAGTRWRRGFVLEGGLRAALRHRGDYTLTRLRAEIAAGYGLVRGAFALQTTIAATAEPWFVTTGGSIAPGKRRPMSALVGGALRVSPQWRIRAGARHVAIGPFVELAGSAVPTADGGVARVRVGSGTQAVDAFRVGGLEIAVGLSVSLWTPR